MTEVSGSSVHPMQEVAISTEMIRLGQLLKLAGLVEDGAHAREVLASERVTVNGEPDNRRGRQLVPGDVVKLAGQSLAVVSGR